MTIAILTPAYNRSNTLNKLYESLLNQTSKDFEWIIIDDGSTDNTKELINSFIKENRIIIHYYYKENGGKHRALNYGIKKITSELTFIVDSDDWLLSNAIEEILRIHDKYKNKKNIGCYSFHKMFSNGMISGPNYKEKEFVDNYISYRINKHITGEKAEVVITKCFKEVPFLEIPGEKFLSEGYFWIKLAMKYDTVYIDKPIYEFEYLDGGLTKNLKRLMYKNPKGVVEIQKLYFNKKFTIIPKVKATIKYIAYGKIAKYRLKELYNDTNCKLLFILLYPIAYCYYLDRRKVN